MEPILSLAVSMHANPGVYALLLGSGVSRSAQVPTGWEVMVALIRKLAHSAGEDTGDDPAGWYRRRFDREPDYSRLLDELAGTSAERQQLLRGYFEPTEEETEQGIKTPTPAHRAIAELVKGGYVRVILTTNFDRLTERAIEAQGVTATVIGSPDAAQGALPLVHSPCTVIKLHGDYLDTRLRNTEGELAAYDAATDALLDRVLDEYGLVVCGWSAQWDTALRAAFERRRSRRFSVYWTARGEPNEDTRRLVAHTQGRLISIEGADNFFSTLAEKVQALEDLALSDPLSPRVAAATVKRYLAEDRFRIRLHDFVVAEVQAATTAFGLENFPVSSRRAPSTAEEFWRRIKAYESQTQVLQQIISILCYWGKGQAGEKLCVRIMELEAGEPRLANQEGFYAELVRLRLYPAYLLMYAGGISAVAGGNYVALAALLRQPVYRGLNNDTSPLLLVHARAETSVAAGVVHGRTDLSRHHTPISDHLFTVFQNQLGHLFSDGDEFLRAFDRFEYLRALVHADLRRSNGETGRFRGPIGSFGWRDGYNPEQSIMRKVAREVQAQGDDWPPLRAGLFGGSATLLGQIMTGLDEQIASLNWI